MKNKIIIVMLLFLIIFVFISSKHYQLHSRNIALIKEQMKYYNCYVVDIEYDFFNECYYKIVYVNNYKGTTEYGTVSFVPEQLPIYSLDKDKKTD